jgi:hypothetical protein
MRVICPPTRLRYSGFAFLLIAPLVALQLALALQLPLASVPTRVLENWTGGAFVLSLVPAIGFFRGHPRALWLAAGMLSAWLLLTIGAALVLVNPGLAFFAVFLAAGGALLLLWIRRQTREAFYDPGLRWYQRLPKPIPGLSCIARPEGSESREEFKVSRLSASGAFIFSDRAVPESLGRRDRSVELEFKFRDRWLRCTALPMVEVDRGCGAGWGLRFAPVPPDLRKNLGDFIEQIRGEGYVE